MERSISIRVIFSLFLAIVIILAILDINETQNDIMPSAVQISPETKEIIKHKIKLPAYESSQTYVRKTATREGKKYLHPFNIIGRETGWYYQYSNLPVKPLPNFNKSLNHKFPGESFLFWKFNDDVKFKILHFKSQIHEILVELEWKERVLIWSSTKILNLGDKVSPPISQYGFTN